MRTILPKQAKAKVEFRLVPDQDPEVLVRQLRHHLDMKGFPDVQIRVLATQRPHQTPINHEFVDTVKRAAEEETGREVVCIRRCSIRAECTSWRNTSGCPS